MGIEVDDIEDAYLKLHNENRDLRVKITKLEAELVDLRQLQEAVKHIMGDERTRQ